MLEIALVVAVILAINSWKEHSTWNDGICKETNQPWKRVQPRGNAPLITYCSRNEHRKVWFINHMPFVTTRQKQVVKVKADWK